MATKPGWTGRVFEDFTVGDVYEHPLGRTVTQADNIWFTCITMNTNPIHFDAEYARDLGYAAVNYLLKGGSGALVTIEGGEFTPIRFADVLDPSGKGRRRAVDVTTESYQVAREYMVRLGPRDFTNAAWVATLSQAAGLGEDAFRARFGRFAHA